MNISVTESSDLFSKDLKMYWEDFIKNKNEIISNTIVTKSLLLEIYGEILKINDLEKDKHDLVQIVTGFLSLVDDHIKELASFEAEEKSFVDKKGLIEEEDRLDVVKILENNEYLKFKTDQLLENIYSMFSTIINSDNTLNDLTKSHILNILNKVGK